METQNIIKSISAYKWVILFNVYVVLFSSCGKDNDEGDISMITPFLTTSDVACIYEAFSSSADAPWGFEHHGIDFFPDGNLKPFQAVSSGTVVEVRLWLNTVSSTWQVNVRIKFNSMYEVGYAFEPVSTVQSDGQAQLENISVHTGQVISQGMIIGNLYYANNASHVDFNLIKNNELICPESYFIPAARDSILYLIHRDHPDWNMCY